MSAAITIADASWPTIMLFQCNLGLGFTLVSAFHSIRIPFRFGYEYSIQKGRSSSLPFQYKLNAAMRRPPGDFLDYNFLVIDEAKEGNNNNGNQTNIDGDDTRGEDRGDGKDDDTTTTTITNNNSIKSDNDNFILAPETEIETEKNLLTNLKNSMTLNFQQPQIQIPNVNVNVTLPDISSSLPNMNIKNVSMPNVNVNVNISLPDLPDVNFMNNVNNMKLPDLPNLPDFSNVPRPNYKYYPPTRKYDKQSGDSIIVDVTAEEDEEYNKNNKNLLLFGVIQELDLELFPSWKQQQQEQQNENQTNTQQERSRTSTEVDENKNMLLFNRKREQSQSQAQSQSSSNVLLTALTSSICKVTGKDTYQFGDLTRYIDSKAKLAVQGIQSDITDLSAQVDETIQGKINSINSGLTMAQQQQQQVQFSINDVTRTLVKKVASGDYQLSDITFLCKILIALGADFTPVAGVLPVRLLIELFGYSTAIDLGERMATALVKELDKRLEMNEQRRGGVEVGNGIGGGTREEVISSKMETGDGRGGSITEKQLKQLYFNAENEENNVEQQQQQQQQQQQRPYSYEAGDLTRQAILEYTGKDSYEVGDVVSKDGSSSKDPVDVLKELEECLAMERKLVEKLNNIKA